MMWAETRVVKLDLLRSHEKMKSIGLMMILDDSVYNRNIILNLRRLVLVHIMGF